MASKGGAIRAGRAFVELFADDSKLIAGLNAAAKRMQKFGAVVSSIGKELMKLSALSLAPLLGAANVFRSMGDALDKASARTGVGVEALQELGFAAEQSGSSMQEMELGLRMMQRSVVGAAMGLGEAKTAMQALGVDMAKIQAMSPDQQFKYLADRLAAIPNPTARAALAMRLFGESGTKLLPLMANGAKGIEALQAEFRAMGVTLSTDDAKAAAAFNDAMHKAWVTVKQGVAIVGGALAPALTRLSGMMTNVVASAGRWIRTNQGLVVAVAAVAAGVGAAGVALYGVGAAIGVVSKALAGLAVVAKLGGIVLGAMLSPIGLVSAAVVALGGYLAVTSGVGGRALSWLRDRFADLGRFAAQTWQGIADALAAGDISLAARVLFASLKVAWQAGVNEVVKIWDGFRVWLVDVGGAILQGITASMNDLWHGIKVIWIEGIAFLKGIWATFAEWHAKAVEEVANAIVTKGDKAGNFLLRNMATTMGKPLPAAPKENPEDKAYLDKQHNLRLRQIDDEKAAQIAAINAERRAARNAESDRYTGREAEIGASSGDAISAARQQQASDARAAVEELRRAQSELADLRTQASQKRTLADVNGPAGMPAAPKLADQYAGLEDLMNLTAKQKLSVSGTFSSNIAALGAGGVMERIAGINERMDAKLQRILDRTRRGQTFE